MMKYKFLTFFYSFISTFSNLISSLVIFIVLARALDKSIFGDYVFYNSLAAISCVLIDFGINQKLLREGRIDLPNLNILFLNNLFFKSYVFSFVFILYSIILVGILNYDFYSILIFLTVASFSFFQLSTVVYRVINDYKLDAIVTFIGSFIFITSCLVITKLTTDIFVICTVLLMVRLSSFLVSLFVINKKVRLSFKYRPILFKKLILDTLPYLTDRIVSVLYSNVDTLIIKYFIGSVGVATYNSGLKLASGSLGVSTILSNIYIPKISVINYENNVSIVEERKVFKELWMLLSIFGLLIVSVFTFLNTFISSFFFNDKFPELIFLLPFFGLFVNTRLMASYYGIILTAIGKQKERARANIISFVGMVVSGIILTYYLGLKGTLLSLIITTILLITFYMLILKRIHFKFLYTKGAFVVFTITLFIVWTKLSS